MVRRHLAGRLHAFRARAPKRLHRLPRGEVQEVQRLSLVGGEREVAFDHQALGNGRIAGEAELRGDLAFVHLSVAREGSLLAVQGDAPCR